MKIQLSKRSLWIVVIVIAVIFAGAAAYGISSVVNKLDASKSGPVVARHTQATTPASSPSQVTPTPTPITTFAKPPKAAFIARQVKCWNFRNTGPAAGGLVVGSGVCYISGKKYGVDTFRTEAARDMWLKMASAYGVSPMWETAQSVVYPSVNKNS